MSYNVTQTKCGCNSHECCRGIGLTMSEKLKQDDEISPKTFELYVFEVYNLLVTCPYFDYNISLIEKIMTSYAPQIIFTRKTISKLISSNNVECITHLCNINYNFDNDIIMHASNQIHAYNKLRAMYMPYKLNALEHLAKNIDMDDNLIIHFADIDMYNIIVNIISQREIINNTVPVIVSDKIFKKIHDGTKYVCRFEKIHDNLLNVLKYKCNLNDMTFYYACSGHHLDTVAHFLDNKFVPKVEHFNAALNMHCNFNDYGGQLENQEIKIKNKMINMFIEYGYDFTYDCLLLTIQSHITINSIDKFNFNYDDDTFMQTCHDSKFYPYLDKIKNKYRRLLRECERPNNIKNIKTIINSNVEPTVECLVRACTVNESMVIKLFLSKGIIPNLRCLQICEANGNKIIKKLILEQYIDTHDESIQNNITAHTLFGNVINCNNNKKHHLLPTMITFYKNNFPNDFEEKKKFNKIKKNVNDYIKKKKLLKSHKLSFKIDKELSQFGLTENKVIQIHDINAFISYIITYKQIDADE